MDNPLNHSQLDRAYASVMTDRAQRFRVLFGDLEVKEWDDADESERLVLVEEEFGLEAAQGAVQVALVRQLLDGDPPAAWDALGRLLDDGRELGPACGQLRLVLLTTMREVLDDERDFDDEAYRQRLDALPLPDPEVIEDVFDRLTADREVVDTDVLLDDVVEELAGDPEEPVVRWLVERVIDQMVDGFGPLVWLSGSRTVHRRAITDGIVLCHRLTEADKESGRLDVAVDLAGFVGVLDPTLAGAGDDAEIQVITDGQTMMWWQGPEGWLDAYPAGSVLAVRVDDAERVTIEVLDRPAPTDGRVVELLRRVVEAEVDEPGLPATAAEVIVAMLAEDRGVFSSPQPPLRELCTTSGLELRGTEIANDPQLWRNEAEMRRHWRLIRSTDEGDESLRGSVLEVLDAFEQLAVGEDITPATMATVFDHLDDEHVFDLVAEELFHPDSDPVPGPDVFASLFKNTKGRSLAEIRALAALVAERDGDPLAAEQHLEVAHGVDQTLSVVIDRLAWYASDRGDAAKAKRLWSEIDGPGIEQALAELEPFTRSRPGLGRNEQCWCGSGRKYKHCHLGQAELAPLPERVGWLCRKAVQYLERSGPEGFTFAYAIAMALADYDEDRLSNMYEDPVVLDLALTEGGWFARFLAARGPLLPDDEALLAASWLTVDRSVYEVTDMRPGESLVVRDLRSGDQIEVRERTFSRHAQVGLSVCARAVPDGQTSQFVGAVLTVPVGQEARVLDLLDDGDPQAIAEWVASLSRPPELRTREGEVVVQCEIVAHADDKTELVRHLDRTYQADEPGRAWSEHHDLDQDENVIRATMHLGDDGRLRISTNSHERADRILDRLDQDVGFTIVSDNRTPVDVASVAAGEGGGPVGLPDLRSVGGPDQEAALSGSAVAHIAQQLERRWCDEPVPALGGLTPHQAAADPTRREHLIRLVDSFERQPPPPGAVTMRPDRLRILLGL